MWVMAQDRTSAVIVAVSSCIWKKMGSENVHQRRNSKPGSSRQDDLGLRGSFLGDSCRLWSFTASLDWNVYNGCSYEIVKSTTQNKIYRRRTVRRPNQMSLQVCSPTSDKPGTCSKTKFNRVNLKLTVFNDSWIRHLLIQQGERQPEELYRRQAFIGKRNGKRSFQQRVDRSRQGPLPLRGAWGSIMQMSS